MDDFPTLRTQRLLLRQETLLDAGAVLAVFSSPKVTQFHDLDTFSSIDEAIGLIERRIKRFETGQGIRWGIARQLDNFIIGSCGFTWDKQAQSAEIGYELNRVYWQQGIMTEALQAILQFGFLKCSLQFVTAEVMVNNTASKRLLCKLGFQSQGVFEQRGFWKGQHHDLEQFIREQERRLA